MKNRLYDALPVVAQNLACTWAGYQRTRARFSRHFYKILSAWGESERFSLEELHRLQKQRLFELINMARESAPYYSELPPPADHGEALEAIGRTLARIPVLEKDSYRENFEKIISRTLPQDRIRQSRTSGTTGTALRLAHTPEAIAEEYATVWRLSLIHI